MGRVKDTTNNYMNVSMLTADIVKPSNTSQFSIFWVGNTETHPHTNKMVSTSNVRIHSLHFALQKSLIIYVHSSEDSCTCLLTVPEDDAEQSVALSQTEDQVVEEHALDTIHFCPSRRNNNRLGELSHSQRKPLLNQKRCLWALCQVKHPDLVTKPGNQIILLWPQQFHGRKSTVYEFGFFVKCPQYFSGELT